VKKWGWIPNTSGDLFSKAYVKEKIEGHCESQTKNYDGRFIFTYSFNNGDAWEIVASCGKHKAKINFQDERGICSIVIDAEIENLVLILWNEFRIILDGCSNTPADCSAMKKLADDGSNIVVSIANCFTDAMERSTDVGIHIGGKVSVPEKRIKDWEDRTISSMRVQNIITSNYLYFKRFTQIYDEELGLAKVNLEAVMRARYKKAKTVSNYNIRYSEFRFEKHSIRNARISWMVAIIGIFATLAIGIINLILL